MEKMNAAVVTKFGEPPHYMQFDVPEPSGAEQTVVDVLAVGLHPRVRTGARGAHYTSSGTLPMVPGIDGVGRRADGKLIYFLAGDDIIGTMAERALLDVRRSVELPDGVDAVKIAAAMNPAMSSWVALRRRVPIQAGQSVLVLGATGNAGTMAVQVARRLGAERVVGAGRNPDRLAALSSCGADEVVRLTDDVDATATALAETAAEVDIVIDYLWGEPAQRAMAALLTARSDRSRTLDWVQIGAIAGPRWARVGGASRGQPKIAGNRPGRGINCRLCRGAAVAGDGDRCRRDRRQGESRAARRCGADMAALGGARRADRARAVSRTCEPHTRRDISHMDETRFSQTNELAALG